MIEFVRFHSINFASLCLMASMIRNIFSRYRFCTKKYNVLNRHYISNLEKHFLPTSPKPFNINANIIRKSIGIIILLKIDEIKQSFDPNYSDLKASVEIELIERVGVIHFESLESNVNLVSLNMLEELIKSLEKLNRSNDIDIIIFRSKKSKSFCAGADIKYFFTPNIVILILLIKKPMRDFYIILCFETNCCSYRRSLLWRRVGGTALALACTYRVSFNRKDIKFGFPEARLGLIPGGLGSYLALTRSPSKVFLMMISAGLNINTQTAKQYGILTHILDDYSL
ncbi:hypothetical protein HZS_255 [Henneguya salminicola]|nr:hypothetical protein HZS_255 [Henneguya salminicola]